MNQKGALVGMALLAALLPDDKRAEPLEDERTRRRREVDGLRDIIMHEPGGIFGPVNRSREQARRLRQQARAAARSVQSNNDSKRP